MHAIVASNISAIQFHKIDWICEICILWSERARSSHQNAFNWISFLHLTKTDISDNHNDLIDIFSYKTQRDCLPQNFTKRWRHAVVREDAESRNDQRKKNVNKHHRKQRIKIISFSVALLCYKEWTVIISFIFFFLRDEIDFARQLDFDSII
jgi:hypothetical protein